MKNTAQHCIPSAAMKARTFGRKARRAANVALESAGLPSMGETGDIISDITKLVRTVSGQQEPWYKRPGPLAAVIGGGIVLVGGIAYAVTR
jgi:hypothetical protein